MIYCNTGAGNLRSGSSQKAPHGRWEWNLKVGWAPWSFNDFITGNRAGWGKEWAFFRFSLPSNLKLKRWSPKPLLHSTPSLVVRWVSEVSGGLAGQTLVELSLRCINLQVILNKTVWFYSTGSCLRDNIGKKNPSKNRRIVLLHIQEATIRDVRRSFEKKKLQNLKLGNIVF